MSVDTEAVDEEDTPEVRTDVEPEVLVERTASHPVLGGLDLLVGLLLLGAIWFALPARWLPLDIGGSLLGLAFVVAGAALLARRKWSSTLARSLALAALVAGASLVTALALAASDLFGRYGPVGMGGGLILFVVFLLLLPYLVIFPAAQLWVLGRARVDETR